VIFDLCKSNKNYYNEGADMADGQSKKYTLREKSTYIILIDLHIFEVKRNIKASNL